MHRVNYSTWLEHIGSFPWAILFLRTGDVDTESSNVVQSTQWIHEKARSGLCTYYNEYTNVCFTKIMYILAYMALCVSEFCMCSTEMNMRLVNGPCIMFMPLKELEYVCIVHVTCSTTYTSVSTPAWWLFIVRGSLCSQSCWSRLYAENKRLWPNLWINIYRMDTLGPILYIVCMYFFLPSYVYTAPIMNRMSFLV